MKLAELHSLEVPPLKPLARLSPSGYAGLLACPLKAVWSANRDCPPPLRGSPAAVMGSIIHSLIEKAVKGDLAGKDCRETLGQLVQEKEALLGEDQLSAWMVPLVDTLADHDMRISMAVSVAAQLQTTTSNLTAGVTAPKRVEVWVETRDKKVGGKIDQLEVTADTTTIRDFKTGELLDETGHVKEAYEQQLKLYAAIYADQTGRWPSRLELVTLDGYSTEVSFSSEGCIALLGEARKTLDGTNKLILGGDPAYLAKPSPETCRFCGYRPVCCQYKTGSGVGAYGDWPMDIEGKILGVSLQPGFKRLSVEPLRAPGTTASLRLPTWVEQQIEPGEVRGFYSLRRWQHEPAVWRGSLLVAMA